MAISDRTPWQRGQIVAALWAEANNLIIERLKSTKYITYEYEKRRALEFVERSALVANYAITKMVIKARIDEHKGKKHD